MYIESGLTIFVVTCRREHSAHCLTLSKRRGRTRAMEFPVYDTESHGALLLGARVAGAGNILTCCRPFSDLLDVVAAFPLPTTTSRCTVADTGFSLA